MFLVFCVQACVFFIGDLTWFPALCFFALEVELLAIFWEQQSSGCFYFIFVGVI